MLLPSLPWYILYVPWGGDHWYSSFQLSECWQVERFTVAAITVYFLLFFFTSCRCYVAIYPWCRDCEIAKWCVGCMLWQAQVVQVLYCSLHRCCLPVCCNRCNVLLVMRHMKVQFKLLTVIHCWNNRNLWQVCVVKGRKGSFTIHSPHHAIPGACSHYRFMCVPYRVSTNWMVVWDGIRCRCLLYLIVYFVFPYSHFFFSPLLILYTLYLQSLSLFFSVMVCMLTPVVHKSFRAVKGLI